MSLSPPLTLQRTPLPEKLEEIAGRVKGSGRVS
jgi:hypothetical protein